MKTVLLWLGIVLVLSVYPTEGTPSFPHGDKVVHFILYAITCALLFTVFKDKPFGKAIVLSILISAGYGFLMELIQGLTPSRDFSLLDQAANTLGAMAGAVFITLKRTGK